MKLQPANTTTENKILRQRSKSESSRKVTHSRSNWLDQNWKKQGTFKVNVKAVLPSGLWLLLHPLQLENLINIENKIKNLFEWNKNSLNCVNKMWVINPHSNTELRQKKKKKKSTEDKPDAAVQYLLMRRKLNKQHKLSFVFCRKSVVVWKYWLN